ncbi:MAG: acetoin utilization protein AcuC [Nitrososphaerota archaeon]|nr:acetoin utilization protein AcuC [Nitrososphaerota archaeon]
MRKAAFIYDEGLVARTIVEDEEFNPSRLKYTYELLRAYRAFNKSTSRLIVPDKADDAALLSFHTRDYVEAVRCFSRGERLGDAARFNFSEYGDNPVFPGMYEVSSRIVGATLKAAELAADGKVDVAFNHSGGGHHAAPNCASGFCIFNDVVIAIKHLLAKGLRVAYVDIDAHHADGVQDAFYGTDKVLNISLHETGRILFPGTGEVSEIGVGSGKGYSVNIPLAPYTDDGIYLWAFDQVVPALVGSFKPDIVFTQLGCDTHYLDPMTQLNLTTEGYEGVIRRLRQLAPKWVAVGGGGYEMSVVARCWTLAYGIMIDREWPDRIPRSYQELYGIKRLRDNAKPRLDSRIKQQARRFAEESVAQVKKLVFPYHRL